MAASASLSDPAATGSGSDGGGLATARALSRADKWWASKVAPLLAAAYLSLLIEPRPPGEAAVRLVVLVASASLLASAAYVVNDWYDREVDRAVGKSSVVMRLHPAVVAGLWAVLVLAGAGCWAAVPVPPVAWGALVAIVALPLVYSAPPLRWKERGGLGLLADAGLAHVAPTTFSLAAFGALDHLDRPEVAVAVAGTVAWSAAAGLRRIIGHELVDVAHDRQAGVTTWVDRVGERRARQIATRVVLPAEVAALAAVLVALAWIAPLAAAVLAAMGAAMAYARAIGAWRAPLPAVPSDDDERAVLYLFLRFWPQVALLVALAARDVGYLLVLVAHLVLFWPVALGELAGLVVAGREAISLTAKGAASWLRYSAWEWIAHTVPNWFRHTLWPPVGGWLRYTAWEWVRHTVPNWFRYTLWEWAAHTVPNWFRHRAWVWVAHTVPNWFRYRFPEHRKAARRRIGAAGRAVRRRAAALRRRARAGAARALRPIRSRPAPTDEERAHRGT